VVDGLFNTPRKDEVSDNDSLRHVVVSEGRLYLDRPAPIGRDGHEASYRFGYK
jgi:hypothetical protein